MMLFDHMLSCCVSYLQFLILIVFTKVPRTKKKNDTLFCSQRPCHVKVEKNDYLEKGQLFQTVYFVLGYSQLTML